MLIIASANAQQTFELNHIWESCSICDQTRGHDYTVKNADLIKDKDLRDYAIIYARRKNGGNYLFGTNADKVCPQSNSGKHNWKKYSETIRKNVSAKILQDFINQADNERIAESQRKCESYIDYAKEYRIGVVNQTLYQLCRYMQYYWGTRNITNFYWENINLPKIENLIFLEKLDGKNVDQSRNLSTNDDKIIIDLYEMIIKGECKGTLPISNEEIEYYGGELDFCNIDNSELFFSLDPSVLINYEKQSCHGCSDRFIVEHFSNILRISYAMALQNVGRKNEALDIYSKTDLTKLLHTRSYSLRPSYYYFAKTSEPGRKFEFDIEPDKFDRIFAYWSIFSYMKLCKDLNVQSKITKEELEGYLIENQLSEELRLRPSDYGAMAFTLINQSDYDNAKYLLKFGKRKFPNSQEMFNYCYSGYNNIGWNLILKKEFQPALLYLKEGSEIYPNDLFILGNLAHAYLLTGDFKSAKKIYKEHIGLNITPEMSWVSMINADFKEFQAAGITSAYFEEILQLINK